MSSRRIQEGDSDNLTQKHLIWYSILVQRVDDESSNVFCDFCRCCVAAERETRLFKD